MNQTQSITLFEGAAIIAGYGIGGGVMAVPYLASLNGIVPFLLLLCLALLISVLFHLMLAEIMLRDASSKQLIEIFNKYLFRGNGGTVFTWLFFALILAASYTNLSAYIAGGGEILKNLLDIPLQVGHTATYLTTAGVVFFGLKAVGISEKYAVVGIALIVGVLTIGSFGLPFEPVWLRAAGVEQPLALFGMIMFSFTSLFSIPQIVTGLSWNKTLIPRAVVLGLFINFSIIFVVTVVTISVSHPVSRIAITGWSKALGYWAFVTGSLFVLLAMLTSYWSISLAMTVIIKERLNWGDRSSWLVSTLPTFLIVITGVTDFLGFMRLAGGAIALMVALLIIPTYRNIKKFGTVNQPSLDLGRLGSTGFQIALTLSFLAMSIGSVLEIN